MNAVLLGINGRFSHTNLALRYLRNEIRAAGHTAQIVEFDITARRQDVLERLALAQPQVLLLSVYVWNALLIRLLLPDIRALLPACRLILGGPEVSYSAAEWIEAHPEIDVIVTGHAEQALRQLAASGFECENRVVSVSNCSFAAIPFPYLEEDFAGLSHRYVYYESSRGCPCSCSYCVSGRDDQAVDFRSVQQTCDELQQIISQERRWPAPPIVKLVDRTFNARPARAREIWRYLIGAETNATFHFEVHPAFLSDEDLELLAGAPVGRFQFEIGVQSVHRATLRSVGRAQNWQRVRPRVQRLIESGMVAVHLDLIAGLPREDIGQLARSIDDIMALKPTRFDLGFLKSLPGTAIRAQSETNGQLAMREPPYQVLQNRWLTLSDFSRLRRIGEVIDALWNSCRLEAAIDALALQHGGYYGAFDMLQRRAGEIGYNLATRQPQKVVAFLDASR